MTSSVSFRAVVVGLVMVSIRLQLATVSILLRLTFEVTRSQSWSGQVEPSSPPKSGF